MSLIRIGGLSLFSRTNSRGHWILASYHSPHSLTWRWVITFALGGWETRRLWPVWMSYRTNNGLQLVVRLPWLGMLRWQQQRPMWFRDLYIRLRDERDGLTTRPRPTPPTPPVVVHEAPGCMQ